MCEAVYGKQPTDLSHVPEGYSGSPDPSQPASAYAEAKRLAEQMPINGLRRGLLKISCIFYLIDIAEIIAYSFFLLTI